MANIYLYSSEPNNIFTYQGVDVEYSTTIYEDAAGTEPLDLTGYTFVARFYRVIGEAALATTPVTNNTGVNTGEIIVKVSDTDLGEHSMDTIGAYDVIGTDGNGTKRLYDWGSFNVKNDPAT